MKTLCLTIYCLSTSLLVADPASSAADLAAQLSAIRQDGASSVRLKMDTGSGTLQIQTKERRTKAGVDVVYQILFPKERKGEAVLLRRSGGHTSGSVLTLPDKIEPISAGQMNAGLFGSDLSYADILENFFAWDSQTLVGAESIGRTECQILESKPKGQGSAYASVRSWIDTQRLVPMRIEKYNAAGKVLCRIETTNVEKDDLDRYLPASMTIQRAGGTTTTVQGTRIRHGVNLTDRDFSPEGMGDLTAPRS